MFDAVFLISTVAVGMIYAISALGLIVTYRVTGVFNLAFGFQAALAAFLYFQLTVPWGLNKYLSACLVILVFGPVSGIVIQRLLFTKARDTLTAIIITIGLGVGIAGFIDTVWGTGEARLVMSLFGEDLFTIGGVRFSANDLGVIGACLVVLASLYVFLNRSHIGLLMRAVVDSETLAVHSGVNRELVSSIAWATGSLLASLAGVLLAPVLNLDVNTLGILVVDAFAVAALAGLSNVTVAVVAAIGLSYAQGLTDLYPNQTHLWGTGNPRDTLPFLLLAIVLLVHPAMRERGRVVAGGMATLIRGRAGGSSLPAISAVTALTILAVASGTFWSFVGINSAIFGLVALSLVLLTGATGQISLCQATFLGMGAVGASVSQDAGIPWVPGLLIGSVFAGLTGLVIACTAFRLSGLFLALITLAFSYAALIVFFQNSRVIGPAGLVGRRPGEVFGVDFSDDRWFLILTAGILIAALVGVSRLLGSPWGRAFQALHAGNDVASVSGLAVRVWKIRAFVLSSMLAGLAGGLFVSSNMTLTYDSFLPLQSLTIMVVAVVGGITSPVGAVFAGLLFSASGPIVNEIVGDPGSISLILFGVMAMQFAVMHPTGLAGMLPKKVFRKPRSVRSPAVERTEP